MKNSELAQIFATLADILEYQGENVFKLNAYRKAARVLDDLTEDIARVAREGRLQDIEGIGDAIAKKIQEYLATGKITRYEEARKAMPPGLLEMLQVPGLGPKTVARLNKALGISNVKELADAARTGKIRELDGMGAKKEENILRGLGVLAQTSHRMLLGEALPLVEEWIARLQTAGVSPVVYAGSLRRMRERIGDIDILAAGRDGAAVVKTFCGFPDVKEVLAEGPTKGSILTKDAGHQIDLRVVDPASFGAALQYFTGSKAHNIRLRDLAKRRHLKVNEYGIFKGTQNIAGADEESVYAALDLAWIPPELREDRGEIDAAIAGRLPQLIEIDDVRGDLHMHTTASDGRDELAAMVRAAQSKGYDYMAISDHAGALMDTRKPIANRFPAYLDTIRKLNARLKGIRVLAGVEVEIAADGSLELADEALAQFDFVIASIHDKPQLNRDAVTRRTIAAVNHPLVHAIGHLTGRLMGKQEPNDIDLDAVCRAAAAAGTLLEINSQPARLDVNDQGCRRGKELGVKFIVNTDAHGVAHLDNMRFGVATARRGWLTKDDIINTRPLKQLLEGLKPKKKKQ